MKIWVKDNVIYHTFYKKDVSSRYTVLKRSALSETTKKDTCFMEVIRRILNISNALPWEETVYHLNRFSRTMQISGYSERERYHTISGAISRVKSMKNEVTSGARECLFRSRQQIVATNHTNSCTTFWVR